MENTVQCSKQGPTAYFRQKTVYIPAQAADLPYFHAMDAHPGLPGMSARYFLCDAISFRNDTHNTFIRRALNRKYPMRCYYYCTRNAY